MKLTGAEASRYLARPDPARVGLMIFGADAMRVALKRQEATLALIGPAGAEEMRLTRMTGAELRRDPALLMDAIKAVGFFPGPRAVLVEDATDGLTDTIAAGLKAWLPGDASIMVTAGGLTGKSTLKLMVEKHPSAVCIGLYDEPPGREEIEAALKAAGLVAIPGDAMAELTTLARALDPGDFRQTIEKISLYKFRDATPLTPDEIAALAPATIEADVDDLLVAVADGKQAAIGSFIRRLEGQGMAPVTLCIGALRYFRNLHKAASDPSGRPVLFGPKRDQMTRQAGQWGMRTLEQALSLLVETDLTLRSSSRAPAMAVMERALIRLAMMKR